MTAQEFLAWLDGYCDAGGADIQVVLQKAKAMRQRPAVPYREPTTFTGDPTFLTKF